MPSIKRYDPAPPWQQPSLLGFTGIRGIVSLAAALAIPFTIADGSPFPHRDLILILTFAVIFVTLVGEGLTLPAVVRALGLANAGGASGRPKGGGVRGSQARDRGRDRAARGADESRKLPEPVVAPIRAHLRTRLRTPRIARTATSITGSSPSSATNSNSR